MDELINQIILFLMNYIFSLVLSWAAQKARSMAAFGSSRLTSPRGTSAALVSARGGSLAAVPNSTGGSQP